jgi:hypothetical protein
MRMTAQADNANPIVSGDGPRDGTRTVVHPVLRFSQPRRHFHIHDPAMRQLLLNDRGR